MIIQELKELESNLLLEIESIENHRESDWSEYWDGHVAGLTFALNTVQDLIRIKKVTGNKKPLR